MQRTIFESATDGRYLVVYGAGENGRSLRLELPLIHNQQDRIDAALSAGLIPLPYQPEMLLRPEPGEVWYVWRGAGFRAEHLAEQLIAAGLAAPAARVMPVAEVVEQIAEANAFEPGDPNLPVLLPVR